MQESKKTIRICALFGSPRKEGFSSGLHESFLSSSSDIIIDRFYIHDLKINPCLGCDMCRTENRCVHHDDMTFIVESIRRSDILSISFPLYFTSLPGPLKTVIDRFQLFWHEARRGHVNTQVSTGIAFVTAGAEYTEMFQPSFKVLSHTLKTLNTKIDVDHSVMCSNLDSKDSDSEYKKALEKAVNSGRILLR